MRTSKQQVWVSAPSHVPDRKPGCQSRIRKYRTILTYKGWPKLTMAAKSHSTLHVALHRNEQLIVGNAALCKDLDDNLHHDLWTDDERGCSRAIEFDAGNQRRDRT